MAIRPKNAAISEAMKKQDEERKSRRAAIAEKTAKNAPAAKAGKPNLKVVKAAAPAKATAVKAPKGESKASIVRAALARGLSISDAAKETGVPYPYVWDIDAAVKKAAAKASGEKQAAKAAKATAPAKISPAAAVKVSAKVAMQTGKKTAAPAKK